MLPALIVSCLSMAGLILLMVLSLQPQQAKTTLAEESGENCRLPVAHLCPGPADLGGTDALLVVTCLFTRSSQCSTKCVKSGEPLSSILSAPRACICGEFRLLSGRVGFGQGLSSIWDVSRTLISKSPIEEGSSTTLSSYRISRHILVVQLGCWLLRSVYDKVRPTSASEMASNARSESTQTCPK